MRQFEQLPTGKSMRQSDALPEVAIDAQHPCGGCGAKVGAVTLSDVLAELSRDFPGHSTGGADDCAAIPASGAVVQSLDVLRQIVADPWLMGRIAANHALSDLYACGAEPVSALAAVTLPFAREAILHRDLKLILAGALEEFSAVSCKLTGGHSMQGAEMSVGFTVNGVPAQGKSLLGKRGLRAGDSLVLTKPLGTGALFAAHMQLAADGRHIQQAIDSMLLSNAVAARLALSHGASACTDVTGFGMLGHLLEMLESNFSARVNLGAVPFLEGALESVRAGIVSTAQEVNATALARVSLEGENDASRVQLLCDPQTSGGLLLGLAGQDCESFCRAMAAEGHTASIIGEVVASSNGKRIAIY